MNYNTIPFFPNPFFWILITSLFFGAAISKISTFTQKAKDIEKAKNRKWILVCLYLTLSIIALLCAIFIPGPKKFLDIRLLYLFCGAGAVFFFIFRFKKAVGMPFVLLFITFSILVILFFQSISAFTGETRIATFRVLQSTGSDMKIEVVRDAENPPVTELVDLEGSYFAPVVKIIIFEDYLVFLGAKSWYRFVGISSFKNVQGEDIPRQTTRYQFSKPGGISESLYAFFEENEKHIPGVKTVQINMDLKRAQSSSIYNIMLQNDGGIEIIEK